MRRTWVAAAVLVAALVTGFPAMGEETDSQPGDPVVPGTMLGDVLTVHRAYPTIEDGFVSPVTTTVTPTSTDTVTLQPPFWVIDPGENNIFIDVESASRMAGSDTVFDGIVFTGFSQPITNVTYRTNSPAFVHDLEVGSDYIALNLSGSFDSSFFVDLQVEFAIPEPLPGSMIGDVLTARRAWPTVDDDFVSPVTTTVTADSSDTVTLQPPFWVITPGENNIFIDVESVSGMSGSDTVFDGMVFTGFSQAITNVTYRTNVSGFVYDLDFGADYIALNLSGSFDSSFFVNLQVELAPADSVPPVVEIESPAPGTVIADAAVPVRATVDDASATTVSSTPAGIAGSLPPGGGTVTGTVELASDGEHTISVSATDAAGNVGGTSVTVVRDATPPGVTVLSPAAGSLLGESPVTVTVEVDDLTATTVAIAGDEVALPAGGGIATFSVVLIEGENEIGIAVTDAAGNVTPASRVVNLDTTAPLVRIDAPDDGDCFGSGDSPVAVTATVDDASATTVVSSPAGISESLAAGGGVVAGAVSLVEGMNTITVTATDPTGRSGEDSITVVLDTTPPSVDFVSPGDGDPVRGTIDVGILASDPAPGSGVDRVELSVDGTLRETLAAAPFETGLDTTALSDGWHTLSARAIDGKGNAREVEVSVLVDNTPPTVAVTGVLHGDIVGGTISLGFSVSDDTSGVVSATLTVGGLAPTTDPSVVYDLPVSSDARTGSEMTTRWLDGEIQVVARAVDDAGNESEAIVTITLDNTNPEKALVSPGDGDVVSGTITLEATGADANLDEIRLLVDGVVVASSTASPLTASLDTTTRLDGEMEVKAIVSDLAGNVTECAARVTLDNMALAISPSTLNVTAKGGAPVFAELTGPNLALLLPVESHTISLIVPGGSPVPAETGWDGDDELSGPGGTSLRVRFSRAALSAAVLAGLDNGSIPAGAETVTVTLVADGREIGTTSIVLKMKGGSR
jgi:hypothetical protein